MEIPVSSRLHKSVESFPAPQHDRDRKPPPDPQDEGIQYFEHLLTLADQFLRAHQDDADDQAA